MPRFLLGHATHPDWRAALALAAAQVDAQAAATPGPRPTLGWAYFGDAYAPAAEPLYAALRERWPEVAWVGASGVGIAATGVEYIGEPALALMLGALPREHFRMFSGTSPLGAEAGFVPHTALVHADGAAPDVAELIAELAERTASGYLFGGLASSRTVTRQLAGGVFAGGLSGVAFDDRVALVSRVTQGCQPIGPVRRVTASDRHVILRLDDRPALDCLLHDLGVQPDEPRRALPMLRRTLVGLGDPSVDVLARSGQFGTDTRVRHLAGIDPPRGGVAVAALTPEGTPVAFCQRDVEAARRDLVRICAEIRDELEPETLPQETVLALGRREEGEVWGSVAPARLAGAIYVSCAGRGGPHFGGTSAELQIVQHALGEVPLVGFFAGGEIARHHLYGYTGVLTVFVDPG